MDEIAGGDDHGGNRGFHVGRTPSVKAAVPYGRCERIGRPFFNGAGRHDVGVAGEDEQGPPGTVPCPEVGYFAGTDRFAFEAGGGQQGPDDLLALPVVRCDGGLRDQVASQTESRVHDGASFQLSRKRSLMAVLARVCASTRLTMTAQYMLYFPLESGRLPGTTTEPDGTRP